MPRRRLPALLAAALLAGGCGSLDATELPPPATPAPSPPLAVEPAGRVVERDGTARTASPVTATADAGRKLAVLDVRERVLDLRDAATRRRVGRATAGTGPTHVVSDGGNYLYVVDTKIGALLIYRIVPELQLRRRYDLAGSPYGIVYDAERKRLWVALTATNELVELSDGARPRELRRFPTVAGPRSVALDPASGRVVVTGSEQVQLLDPPPLPRSR